MCEFVAFHAITYPRARKRRLCPICYWHIEPGERYARHVQKGDDIDTLCMHVECEGAGPAWTRALKADCYEPCGYALTEEVWLGRHPQTGEWLALQEWETQRYDEERDEYLDVPVYRSRVAA